MNKCKMRYLITSSSTWESEDSQVAFCYHELLEAYNTNWIHLNSSIEVESSDISATPEICVNNSSDSLNLDNELSYSSSSETPTQSQGNSRKRRTSAVSGEWYRRVCLQDAEWGDSKPRRKMSKEALKQKRPRKTQPIVTDSQLDPTDLEAPLQSTPNTTPNQMFRCDICSELFKLKRSLLRHHQLVHTKELQCPTCGKSFGGKANLAVHMTVHSDARPYKCDTCGNTFKVEASLLRHQRIHIGATPFKCSYCDKAFGQPYRCKAHEATHDQTLRHVCDRCGKSFANGFDLTRHNKVKHSSLGYPFKCKMCDRGFERERLLKDHLNSHTGETPYKCNVCNKMYKAKLGLDQHKKTHIPYTERPLKCELCTARFWENCRLLDHMEVNHLPKAPVPKVFRCTMCNKEFSDKKERNAHRNSHLVCHVCHKKFKVRKNLKDHMKLHPYAEQPFNCKLCGTGFWFESELVKHSKVSHLPEATMVYACKVCKMEFTDKKERTIHHLSHIGVQSTLTT